MESSAKRLERYAKKLIAAVGLGMVAVILSAFLWHLAERGKPATETAIGSGLVFILFIMPVAFIAGAITGVVAAGRKPKPLPEDPKIVVRIHSNDS